MAGKHHTKIPNYEGIFNFTYYAQGISYALYFQPGNTNPFKHGVLLRTVRGECFFALLIVYNTKRLSRCRLKA